MAGAYVAKPEIISTPDIPDSWNVNWAWPGSLPPGFDPVNDTTEDYFGTNENNPSDPVNHLVVKNFPLSVEVREDGSAKAQIGVFILAYELSDAVRIYRSTPRAAVTIPITCTTDDDITYSPTSLTFTRCGVAQFVDIYGVDDGKITGDRGCIINIGPTSSTIDDYEGVYGDPVDVTVLCDRIKVECEFTYSAEATTTGGAAGGSGSLLCGFVQYTFGALNFWRAFTSVSKTAGESSPSIVPSLHDPDNYTMVSATKFIHEGFEPLGESTHIDYVSIDVLASAHGWRNLLGDEFTGTAAASVDCTTDVYIRKAWSDEWTKNLTETLVASKSASATGSDSDYHQYREWMEISLDEGALMAEHHIVIDN